MRAIYAAITAILLIGGVSGIASAQHENDLLFGIENGKLTIKEPATFEVPKWMSAFQTRFVRDQGVDFYLDANTFNYQLQAMRWQQVSITPGLTGGNRFGGTNPGFVDLDWDNPHIHYLFVAQTAGVYEFKFRLTNGISASGQPVMDSDVLTMMWVAGSQYANLPLKRLYDLPDTPSGAPANGFAGVQLTGMVVSSTSARTGGFFIQNVARTGGIFVQSATAVAVGDVVNVQGFLQTDVVERIINAVSVTKAAGTPPKSLGVQAAKIGTPPLGKYSPGIADWLGLGNYGLLIRTAGKITIAAGKYYINDASIAANGIRIAFEKSGYAQPLPANGSIVRLTGISAIELDGNNVTPIVYPVALTNL